MTILALKAVVLSSRSVWLGKKLKVLYKDMVLQDKNTSVPMDTKEDTEIQEVEQNPTDSRGAKDDSTQSVKVKRTIKSEKTEIDRDLDRTPSTLLVEQSF